MRFLLTLQPLSLSSEVARSFSGHSLRHLMPTLARALGFSKEDRDELARRAPTPGSHGERRAMSNLYAQEAECGRVLAIVTRLLVRVMDCVSRAGGLQALPPMAGWDLFVADGVGFDTAAADSAGAEASSSESEDDAPAPIS
uniref:Uncharacterized protein n=1 Tax=Coccolithus braarudii TaxID=221442 RepID=A0A7S0LP36_9EUKA|mmetsp:Transcript_47962/g.102456  ORF Transcript_47962/g.102456 Transcript_47962/m.102456 type:complete len:142 (+) Transcript_47962:624-1049(+)